MNPRDIHRSYGNEVRGTVNGSDALIQMRQRRFALLPSGAMVARTIGSEEHVVCDGRTGSGVPLVWQHLTESSGKITINQEFTI
jgi:hypothetical protein